MKKEWRIYRQNSPIKELLKDILQGRGKLSQKVWDVRSNSKDNSKHVSKSKEIVIV